MPRILAAGFVLAAFITTLPLAVAAFTDRRALAAAFVIGLFIISSAAGGILTGCHEGREHQGDSECEAITGDAAKWLGLVDVSRVPTNINNMIFDDEDGDRRSRIVSELPWVVPIGLYLVMTGGLGAALWLRYRRLTV